MPVKIASSTIARALRSSLSAAARRIARSSAFEGGDAFDLSRAELRTLAAGVTKENDRCVAKYTAHIFRHAAASLWVEQGMNPKRVQALVGHGSIQVTFDVYGHLFEQVERDANDANAIERAIFSDAT